MPGSADAVQKAVHTLEAGGLSVWLKRALLVVAIAGLAVFYLFHFRGLASAQAMDQAQIGRELARGHGFKTNFARPLAFGQLQRHGKNAVQQVWTDTYQAPLPPIVDAITLLPVKSHWKMNTSEVVSVGDKAIAGVAVLLFFASLVVLFFTARRLFDSRLAYLACGLVLLSDMFWQYSLSGLPQMLLLLLFNATIYAVVRALEAQKGAGLVGVWLALAGAGFGLLALTHALTIWMFVPALIFIGFHFRPRGFSAVIVFATFALLYTPWLARNYLVCGNPGGSAIYAALDGIGHSEAGYMRRIEMAPIDNGPGSLRNKVTDNFLAQLGRLFEYFGWSVVAPVFFVALLHVFRREETAALRWLILAMWGGAVAGMAVYGLHEEQGVAPNQLHLLFVPMMTCFGLAYLLVQWNRSGVEIRLARIGFIAGLFLLCAIPMLCAVLLVKNKPGVRWPPYVPPYLAILNDWMQPGEIVASDMPWAIAWYADRRSVWMPETVKKFTEYSDYAVFGAPINGLYFSPISGSQNSLNDVLKGEYRDWAPVIMRSVDLQRFPLHWAAPLGLENECIFFSDHDRQRAPRR